ncbi:hypothetical protein [Olsenella sp. An290]|uniref:hypothetical protein n=1 Tax=Olsenella sp. An290 TaxID=1965625 RepID=UPI0013029D11|nr:hypothetical protein [Olsenella sp. An290]
MAQQMAIAANSSRRKFSAIPARKGLECFLSHIKTQRVTNMDPPKETVTSRLFASSRRIAESDASDALFGLPAIACFLPVK